MAGYCPSSFLFSNKNAIKNDADIQLSCANKLGRSQLSNGLLAWSIKNLS